MTRDKRGLLSDQLDGILLPGSRAGQIRNSSRFGGRREAQRKRFRHEWLPRVEGGANTLRASCWGDIIF